jgi:hypothetical protein
MCSVTFDQVDKRVANVFGDVRPSGRICRHNMGSNREPERRVGSVTPSRLNAHLGVEPEAVCAVCLLGPSQVNPEKVRRTLMVTVSNSGGPQGPHVTLVPASVPEREPEPLDDLEMSLPSPQTFFLGGLFTLSAFVVLYLANSIILPIVLAFVLKLLLQPAVRLFERLYVPRPVGALVAIMLVVGTVVGLGAVLSLPAATWAQKLPEGIPGSRPTW